MKSYGRFWAIENPDGKLEQFLYSNEKYANIDLQSPFVCNGKGKIVPVEVIQARRMPGRRDIARLTGLPRT